MVSLEFRWGTRFKAHSLKVNILHLKILLISYLVIIHKPLDIYNYPMYNVPN
jgi:hypothetical protein